MQTDSLLWLPLTVHHKTVTNRRRQQSKKENALETEPICTVLIYEFLTLLPSPSSAALHSKLFGFILLFLLVLEGNCEPSLEFGQRIFVKFEGAHNGISRERVYASCIPLYVLHFRAISQTAPLCNVYLAQKCKLLHCLVRKSSTSFPSGIIPALVLYPFVHMPLLENAFLLQNWCK